LLSLPPPVAGAGVGVALVSPLALAGLAAVSSSFFFNGIPVDDFPLLSVT
jgi:hypothetical protein